jgi:hypothetical protein
MEAAPMLPRALWELPRSLLTLLFCVVLTLIAPPAGGANNVIEYTFL